MFILEEIREELDILSERITELSKKVKDLFQNTVTKQNFIELREEVHSLNDELVSLRKDIFSRLTGIDISGIINEKKELLDILNKADKLNTEIRERLNYMIPLYEETRKFTEEKRLLKEKMEKITRYIPAPEKALDKILEEFVLLEDNINSLKEKMKKFEKFEENIELKIVEFSTQLKLIDKNSEKMENRVSDRLADISYHIRSISEDIKNLDKLYLTLQNRILEYDKKINKEFAIIDGRIRNIEKGLLERIEEIEYLEKKQKDQIEHIQSIIKLLSNLPEKIRKESGR